jgi:hypothetical protein
MIELWQALLISLTSGILSGALVGFISLTVQQRQLKHERTVERRTLQRERRIERIRPILDALDELEEGLGMRLARRGALDAGEIEYVEEIDAALQQKPPVSELAYRLRGLAYRIHDSEAVDQLQSAAWALFGPSDAGEFPDNLGSLHEMLDEYILGDDAIKSGGD